MSNFSSTKLVALMLVVFSILVFNPTTSEAQIIKPNGNPNEASSQLIFYYATIDEDSEIQITNTHETMGTWIHVQIFRSFNSNPDPTNVNAVICDERNFADFLTPNDTHVYDLDGQDGDGIFNKNINEGPGVAGDATNIDLVGTFGFVVITPVVSESDFTAISFQHLIGKTKESDFGIIIFGFGPEYIINAMGRDAVDFTTGEVLPDNTPLDGVNTGFVVVQPEELFFDFLTALATVSADVVGIVFKDQYGPPGLLGYSVLPGDVTWTTFMFDFKEDPTSCGMQTVECFLSLGLNETLIQTVRELSGVPLFAGDGDLLCSGVETPELPDNPPGLIIDVPAIGWTKIFISGFDDFENHFGLYIPGLFQNLLGNSNIGSGWMYSNAE